MGDKEKNLNEAISFIKNLENTKIEKVSSFIVTEPWGYLEQDEFLNGALKIKTLLSPKDLLKKLLNIENEMKRVRELRWGPRILI